MHVRYENAEHTFGVITLDDGTELHGPLPPNDGAARAAFERFIEEGGEPEAFEGKG